MIDYEGLPKSLRDGAKLYIEHGIPMGSFLSAVAENDLEQAVRYADAENLRLLRQIVEWWSDCAPVKCHGSYEAVKRWLGE